MAVGKAHEKSVAYQSQKKFFAGRFGLRASEVFKGWM
jgi:hypothetical protein